MAGFDGRGSVALSSRQPKADTFLELLRPLRRPLEVYCRRLLRDRSDVEDALQSALAQAYRQFDLYVEGTNFKAWLFRFVTWEIFNRNRKHEPVALGEAAADLPAEESWELVAMGDAYDALLEDPDRVLECFDDLVADALVRLPAVERAVLLLRAIGEFSYSEIHELLSIPIGSVMGYLSRARKRLRVSLADYAAERGLLRRNRP